MAKANRVLSMTWGRDVHEEHGVCTRDGCELPTVNDDVCWWCRNEDAKAGST